MIFPDALAQKGLSNAVLKRIMTAEPPKNPRKVKVEGKKKKRAVRDQDDDWKLSAANINEVLPPDPSDWEVRQYLETIIQGEILEGQTRSMRDFDKHSTVDLAYASAPIHPIVRDLMKCAQGLIRVEQAADSINCLTDAQRKKLFLKDSRGRITGVKAPKLIEVSHNLVHSLVTRRVAALATEVEQQYPLLKFEPYSNTQVGRLVGDVMTQIGEQMRGAYGYNSDYEESIRHATLYTDCVKFKKSAWHVEKQMMPVETPRNGAKNAGREAKVKYERKIVREGVLFTIPHPTRRYFDISRPLSKANQGLGPRWGGHWEPVPLGEIRQNPDYWNKDKLVMDADVLAVFSQHPTYFRQYYDSIDCEATVRDICRVETRARAGITASAEALSNSREAQIGAWAQLQDETAAILTQHYKQVIPKNVGLGTYEDPVWIRFVMAGGRTCVYAEIVGSEPWSVNSYNSSDGLILSPTFASQAMQWQQQLTNHLNELAHVQAQGMVRIWALNVHGMKKDQIEIVENALQHPDFTELKDIIIEYDAEKFAQRGQDIRTIQEKITQINVQTSQKVTEIFGSIMNTLALAERQMFFSPQELGQVSARTTSATEQKAIKDTTLGIRDFHLIGVKRQMEADKRIIQSSHQAFGSETIQAPIAERYDIKIIEAAGFEVVDEDGGAPPPDGKYTIRGKKSGLLYNYTFTSRQTDDTPPDAARAQGIAAIYEIVSKDAVISGKMTLEQRYELANSLFDQLAPGIFKLRVAEGQDGKMSTGTQTEQLQQQLTPILKQFSQQLQQLQQAQAETEAKVAETDAGIKALSAVTKQLAGLLERQANAPEPRPEPSTRRGQISPQFPVGSGAPPLNGVVRPAVVPALT